MKRAGTAGKPKVYVITNNEGRIHVGMSSTNVYKRIQQHRAGRNRDTNGSDLNWRLVHTWEVPSVLYMSRLCRHLRSIQQLDGQSVMDMIVHHPHIDSYIFDILDAMEESPADWPNGSRPREPDVTIPSDVTIVYDGGGPPPSIQPDTLSKINRRPMITVHQTEDNHALALSLQNNIDRSVQARVNTSKKSGPVTRKEMKIIHEATHPMKFDMEGLAVYTETAKR